MVNFGLKRITIDWNWEDPIFYDLTKLNSIHRLSKNL